MTSLVSILDKLAVDEGFNDTCLPEVCLMRSSRTHPTMPVSYEPSIVIIAQGKKLGRLSDRTFVYDPQNYLVLSVPLPFECATVGTPEEPMLGLSVRVDPATVAELLLELEADLQPIQGSPQAIDAIPLTAEISDAALRLARVLKVPAEARILGKTIIREITYRALLGGQGSALRALVTPQNNLSQIARALRRMHRDYAQTLDVGLLARESGMSVSTFHANFKAVTAKPPQRYLQTIRLHKAQTLLVAGASVAEAARLVGYESHSQFSREFKRLFGGAPKDIASRTRSALALDRAA